jgi:hypothetical protein
MDESKLKIILSLLAGVVFAFIFILLAFALPLPKKEHIIIKKPKGKLEQISHSVKNQ